jgi:hypothetical protein
MKTDTTLSRQHLLVGVPAVATAMCGSSANLTLVRIPALLNNFRSRQPAVYPIAPDGRDGHFI